MIKMTKNFDFLTNEDIQFEFKDNIINFLTQIEYQLINNQENIEPEIFNIFRKIRECVICQLCKFWKVKFEDQNGEMIPAKNLFKELKEITTFRSNEYLAFDNLRVYGNENSHFKISHKNIHLEGKTNNLMNQKIESFEVVNSLKSVWVLIKLILRTIDDNLLNKMSNFSELPYRNIPKKETEIIPKNIIEKIEINSFKKYQSFTIERAPISSLLSLENQTYRIPIYQRGYDWDESNISTLIKDIEKRMLDKQEHYFGVIAGRLEKVATFNKEKIVKIIDGQQRMTTSALLITAANDVLKNKFKTNPIFTIKSKFTNPGGNENSNNSFKDILLGNIQKLEKNIYEKENYYKNYKKLYDYLFQKKEDQVILFISTYIENFKIGVISFDEESITNKKEMEIFENLNSKGKELEIFDLTKNYIFNLCNEETLSKEENEIIILFNKMISNLYTDDPKVKTNWMNSFFESLIHYATGEELPKKQGKIDPSQYLNQLDKTFKILFNKKNNSDVSEFNFNEYKTFIKNLERYLNIWISIKFNEKEISFVNSLEISKILKLISRDKKLSIIYPLMYFILDAYKVDEENLKNTLPKNKKEIKNWLFQIIKQIIRIDINKGQGNSDTARTLWKFAFNGCAQLDKNKEIDPKKLSENILKEIIEYSKNSGNFLVSLSNIDKPSWAHISLLQIIEWTLLGYEMGGPIFSYEKATLEHFLPQKYEDHWINDFILWNPNMSYDEIQKQAMIRINKFGNFLILSNNWNSKNSNLSFKEKKEKLTKCKSPLYQNENNKIDISRKNEWNFKDIDERTEELIKFVMDQVYS